MDPRNPDPRLPPQPTRFCPRCKSQNVELGDYLGVRCVKCRECGYDECQQYEIYPDQNVSQREKGRFTPYRTGGGSRVRKS